MAESRKVVMVGIPGVGKTTLVSKIVEILNSMNKSVTVQSFGTVMLEEAKKNGLENRDELRNLSTEEQIKLQRMAAEKIASLNENFVIIDTHAFINTSAGYYPGLPQHVLNIIKPSNYISVSAKPEEIYNRRMNDLTRNRDKVSLSKIKKELDVQEAMISACSVISGSPMKPIINSEGKIEEAANKVINAIGL